jgi:hypothetical protein
MRYTLEQKQWLKDNIGREPYSVTAKKFYDYFGIALRKKQISMFAWNNSLGIENHVYSHKLYTEKLMSDGYIYVKISNTEKDWKNWKAKHRAVYEQAHGHIPKGHIIIFLDGNKRNFAIENLYAVTRAENIKLSQYGFISKNRDITLTGIAIVKHQLKIHELFKNKLGEKEHKLFINRKSAKRVYKQ